MRKLDGRIKSMEEYVLVDVDDDDYDVDDVFVVRDQGGAWITMQTEGNEMGACLVAKAWRSIGCFLPGLQPTNGLI